MINTNFHVDKTMWKGVKVSLAKRQRKILDESFPSWVFADKTIGLRLILDGGLGQNHEEQVSHQLMSGTCPTTVR